METDSNVLVLMRGVWYPGAVEKVHDGGTLEVTFLDGDFDSAVHSDRTYVYLLTTVGGRSRRYSGGTSAESPDSSACTRQFKRVEIVEIASGDQGESG